MQDLFPDGPSLTKLRPDIAAPTSSAPAPHWLHCFGPGALLPWRWGPWMVPGEWVDRSLFESDTSHFQSEGRWNLLLSSVIYSGHVMSIFMSNDSNDRNDSNDNKWHCWYATIHFYSSSSDWIRWRQPPSASAFASDCYMHRINGPAPWVLILNLQNLRHTLLNLGQIWTDWLV